MTPTVPAAHYRLGLVYSQQARPDEARASYNAALALDPGFALAREALRE